MFFLMFGFLVLIFIQEYVVAQFFNAEIPWQFAGFAAINVPADDQNDVINPYLSNFASLQHQQQQQQQLQLQELQSRNRIEQQIQQQTLIQSPHNHPLLPNAIAIPKRENGNVLSVLKTQNIENEKERHQELPDFARGGTTLEHATYLSLINDKENFQASGCGWDLIRLQCHDLFGLCKGGCRDFAIALNSPIHDCRCVPFGYLALVKLAGK